MAMACAAWAAPSAAVADEFPSKPIRLVIPYATGGVSDSIGRVLAKSMTDVLGQSVVAENRGGGGGTIGAAVVAAAPPDGYTILLTSPPMVAVAPVLLKNLSYRAIDDFTAIGTLVTTPNILAVNNDLPVKSLADMASYAKGEGRNKLSFASAGPGSTGHLSGQILQNAMNIAMTHVPYKSSGLAFPDVISGRVRARGASASAGGDVQGTVLDIAGRAHRHRSGLPLGHDELLDGHRRAGQHATGRRGEAQCRHPQGGAVAGDAQAARHAGSGTLSDQFHGVRAVASPGCRDLP